MGNFIVVTYQCNKFNITVSVDQHNGEEVVGIENAKKANRLAKKLEKKYLNQGVKFRNIVLWDI